MIISIMKQIFTLSPKRRKKTLFNHALNTFYLWLYGIGHIIKDLPDSERGNLLLPHGLLFLISSKGSFYAPSHRQNSTYHGLCYTSRAALAGTRNRSMGPPWRIDRPSITPWLDVVRKACMSPWLKLIGRCLEDRLIWTNGEVTNRNPKYWGIGLQGGL